MSTLNPSNVKFLQNYNNVLEHHVECISNYPLALYEDKQLLRVFWNGYTLYKEKRWNNIVISVGCVALGVAASIRVKHVKPLIVSLLPCSIPIYKSINCSYSSRRYKSNFEELLKSMLEGFILLWEIKEHVHKYKVLERVSEKDRNFSKFVFLKFVTCLDEIKSNILNINKVVPLIESNIDYQFDNLNTLHELIKEETVPLNCDYQRLLGDYILFVSYFLNCIGMCLCEQLWRDGSCCFKQIFDDIIPEAYLFFDTAFKEINCEYDKIRCTLNKFINEGPQKNFINTAIMNPMLPLQNKTIYPSFKTSSVIFAHIEQTFKHGTKPYTLKSDFVCFLNSLKKRKADHKIDLSHLNSKEDQICYENVWGLKEFEDEDILSGEESSHEGSTLNENKPLLQDLDYLLLQREGKNKTTWFTKFVNPNSDECLRTRTNSSVNQFPGPSAIENSEVVSQRVNDLSSVSPFSLENTSSVVDSLIEPFVTDLAPHPWEITEVTIENETSRQRLERILNERRSVNTNTNNVSSSPLPLLLPSRISLEVNSNEEENLDWVEDMRNFQEAYRQALFAEKDNEFHFGFNMYPDVPRPFNTTYSCYSVAMLPGNERQDVERGGKIIMPPSALEQLTRLNINYPMLFKITNKKTNCKTHCGVLEFVADEGKVYLPLWMMQNLVLEEGNLIQIESVSLPVGTFAKFQPVSSDFLDISNPKAVLENCLRTFACLTAGDVIAVTYNQKVYELNVMETKPGEAISIIECDMNVEFAAPVGYKEEVRSKPKEEDVIVDPAELMPAASGFVPFRGDGNRLDGKPRKDSASTSAAPVKAPYVKGIPDYDWEFGTLSFSRHFVKTEENNEIVEEFKPFHGTGHSLR